ncbi:MAG: hypothetical protein HZA60_05835 [Deltaproteobacteria bacterium]|nr:hypothetical protein [Deltaproteobacteria bacterium]
MSGLSLCFIDWKLAGKELFRETAGRFLLFFVLGTLFVAMLLSGGVNRFLSEQWAVTAILQMSVPAEGGRGIAAKAAGLPGVRRAVYKDPEAAWKEFIAAYPGLESLRSAGGNPLPGYVEIRMRPGRLTEKDIKAVEAALRPLPQVDKLLSGGEALTRLLRVKDGINVGFRVLFGFLCVACFATLFLQEKARAASLAADFAFLGDRGTPRNRIAFSRALGAGLIGCLLALVSLGAAALALSSLVDRLPYLGGVIGPAEEVFAPGLLVPALLFLLSGTLLSAGASLMGWRAARPAGK